MFENDGPKETTQNESQVLPSQVVGMIMDLVPQPYKLQEGYRVHCSCYTEFKKWVRPGSETSSPFENDFETNEFPHMLIC